MGVSKKVRFAVFNRDNFTCQYCGRKPPLVVLQCDHQVPVARGGSDDPSNLITACFDCNNGKSDTPLAKGVLLEPWFDDVCTMTDPEWEVW